MAKNIYQDLEIKDFYDEDELLNEIIDKAYSLRRGHTVDIVAKAELINFLFIELVQSEDFGVAFVEFDNTSFNNDGIYVLTIDDDLNIWIEECVRDGKAVTIYSTHLYMYDNDVLQCVIDENIDEAIFPTLFGFCEDEEDNFKVKLTCESAELIDKDTVKLVIKASDDTQDRFLKLEDGVLKS